MTKYVLVHKLKALQNIYIKSMLDELRCVGWLFSFCPLAIGCIASGKDLLSPEDTTLIMEYLSEFLRLKIIQLFLFEPDCVKIPFNGGHVASLSYR